MTELNGGTLKALGVRVAAAERVLRAGGHCRIDTRDRSLSVQAVEALSPGHFDRVIAADDARLLLTSGRARSLGIDVAAATTVSLRVTPPLTRELFEAIVDPATERLPLKVLETIEVEQGRADTRAATALAKRAGLLPVLVGTAPRGLPDIALSADEVLDQQRADVDAMRVVVETPLPNAAVENARLILFRSPALAAEHLALVIGDPFSQEQPLCRLHSECLTGDVFGSLRCDCGEQLHGAMARMAEQGGGVVLYLRQEGRGIGLVNKLRAYRLQDQGLDTVDANTHLGFEPDERDFAIAARMLHTLGIERIRLLTNNPEKLHALCEHGVEVVERIPLRIVANRFNRGYLETKAEKSGHLLRGGDAVVKAAANGALHR